MRPEEDEKIAKQRAEVEETIEREVEEKEQREEGDGGLEENGHDQRNGANGSSEQRTGGLDAIKADSVAVDDGQSSKVPDNESPAQEQRAPEEVGLDDKGKDDDHGGDELLEAHDEDQVIY